MLLSFYVELWLGLVDLLLGFRVCLYYSVSCIWVGLELEQIILILDDILSTVDRLDASLFL